MANSKKPKTSSPSYHTVELFLNSLPSSKADFTRLIAVVSIAAAVAAVCNLIASSLNQSPKPFCDSTYSDPDYSLSAASDYCEPCPYNGLCYDGELKCGYGYRKHGKLCVEDGDINKEAAVFSKWVQVHLCEAYARLLCTGTGKCWVSEDELLSNLNEYKMRNNHDMDEDIYVSAKQRAMETVSSVMETRTDNHGVKEFKCSELLVNHYAPLSCVVRQWIVKNALLSISAFALFLGCISLAYRAYRKHHLSARAEQFYHEVCDILEEKKPLVPRSISGDSEPWVVSSWLRDHLLSPMERKDPFLWRKVEELIGEDSRVDQYPKIVKGESKVVWEWQVESSLSSSVKRNRSNETTSELKEFMTSSSNIQRRMHAGFTRLRGYCQSSNKFRGCL